MEEKIEQNRVRLYPSDWRWSASIVGIHKYFRYLKNMKYKDTSYEKTDDYIEFDEVDITDEDYLLFAEYHFRKFMYHKEVEDLIDIDNPTEEQIDSVNEKLSNKNNSSNTIMKKIFKGLKYSIDNTDTIKSVIEENRLELIKHTFKGRRALYYNFCNENDMLSEKGKRCRIRGYNVDKDRKIQSLSYGADKETFVYQDSRYFDFIPFAFSKTREAFFINNNFTIEQLVNSNKDNVLSNDKPYRSQLFFKTNNPVSFIDYDVEVIKKEREKNYFETIFVRKKAVKILEEITEDTIKAIENDAKVKKVFAEVRKEFKNKKLVNKRDPIDNKYWLLTQKVVTNNILNNIKLDFMIEKLLRENDKSWLISHLIKINQLIYEGGNEMTNKQKNVYAAAMQVKEVLKRKENKLRAYEQKLISAITLKDYDKVQNILIHLSSFTQVKMDFLIDVFENFEENKNLVYTFINTLGIKKKRNEKGEEK